MGTLCDVGLNANGDLGAFNRIIVGRDLVLQRIGIRLRTFLGEWILDSRKGLPFLAWIAKKPPDPAAIGAVVRKEIETTPGVLRVDSFTSVFVPATQEITITCTIYTDEGEVDATISPLGRTTNRNPSLVLLARRGGLGA